MNRQFTISKAVVFVNLDFYLPCTHVTVRASALQLKWLKYDCTVTEHRNSAHQSKIFATIAHRL